MRVSHRDRVPAPRDPSSHSGALMVCGATSGAGKSTVTAALCRALARRGSSVAPFKAQNMSNHAAVTDDGGEVGRAQAMQALAAGAPLDRRMNPILLKPTSDHKSHIVIMGEEVSTTDAARYGETARRLRPVVLGALTSLRADYDWVIAEGAGGAAEINLLDRDLVNLPLALAAGVPAILVVDIERGGAFAAAHGTIDLLPEDLRGQIVGIVFNRFRGDVTLLASGIAELEARSGVPVLGVLPHLGTTPMLGIEDSLDVGPMPPHPPRSSLPVRVAAIRLPHLANPSDLDPLAVEPDVDLHWVTRPSDILRADLVVIPGSRATVNDLAWLRETGFAAAIEDTKAWIVGICGGYQMLGHLIHDDIESNVGTVPGLGLLRVETTFSAHKTVRRSYGYAAQLPVQGYEIRFGRPVSHDEPWFQIDNEAEGAVDAANDVYGTSLHGLFDADAFRNQFLGSIADAQGRVYEPSPLTFATRLDEQNDRLADWVEEHLDLSHIMELAGTALPPEQACGW